MAGCSTLSRLDPGGRGPTPESAGEPQVSLIRPASQTSNDS
jgi:hypothetical protein